MGKRIGSRLRKTRYKLKRNYKEKGKLSLSRYFQEFQQGDKVNLKTNPSVQKGQFHRRFYGLTGTVTGSRKGSCYEVLIKDGDKNKTVFVHPTHLSK